MDNTEKIKRFKEARSVMLPEFRRLFSDISAKTLGELSGQIVCFSGNKTHVIALNNTGGAVVLELKPGITV